MIKTINQFSSINTLLIGDLILDRFVFGHSSRISREAPVLVLKYRNETLVPGGGGNGANNLLKLNCNLKIASLLGDDESGKKLLDYFSNSGADMSSVIVDSSYTTSAKTRIMAGGLHTTVQQVIRIDRENKQCISDSLQDKFLNAIKNDIKWADLIILSDYGVGVFTKKIIEEINDLTRKYQDKVFLVDSRYQLTSFKGMTISTPNEEEAALATGVLPEDMNIKFAGEKIMNETKNKNLLITRGSQGMALFRSNGKTSYVPIYGSADISDVTGAGDTVSATIGLSIAAGADAKLAAKIATLAASVVVHQPGTVPIYFDELLKLAGEVEKKGEF
ncbi:carbohydrate kinase [bacterium]|nr:carbohydrate kinase [bacterium]